MVCFLTDKSSFNFNIWEKMDPCNMMHETSIKYSDDPIIHMIKSYIRRPNKFVSCIFYVGLYWSSCYTQASSNVDESLGFEWVVSSYIVVTCVYTGVCKMPA